MHKRILNACRVQLEIHCEGPLLVRSGTATVAGPDMAPVLTWRGGKEEPFIPGSSLKGVFRTHVERIARTLLFDEGSGRFGACDPFGSDADGPHAHCGPRIKRRLDEIEREPGAEGGDERDGRGHVAYRLSCPACKIFGNTHLRGRLSVGDAYLLPGSQPTIESRDHVAINRFTGKAENKFDAAVVTGASFATRIELVNFELWQIGMLAFLFRDLADGLLSVGGGRSRGFGQVTGKIATVRFQIAAAAGSREDGAPGLLGLRSLDPAAAGRYGYWEVETAAVPVDGAARVADPLGLRVIYELDDAGVQPVWQATSALAVGYLETYESPAVPAGGRP